MQSLREFSRLTGISPTTISRAFHKSDLLAPKTLKKVKKLAQQHGFRPAPVNRAVFGGRTQSIGIMIAPLVTSYFADICMGIQQELLKKNYLPMIIQSHDSNEKQAIQRLIDHRVDAIVLGLINEDFKNEIVNEILPAGIPIVLVEPWTATKIYDSVATDDVHGGFLAGEHLVQLGHKRVGYCYYGAGASTCEPRLEGFKKALESHGLALRECDIAHQNPFGDNISARFQEEIRAILSRPDRPTAFFAPTDHLAMAVYSVAKRMGIRIPEELSVVGYANLNFSEFVDPPLTTIRQNGKQVGHLTGKLVLHRLEGKLKVPKTLFVPTQLIVRSSTSNIL